MAEFLPIFESMILNEGGYQLTHRKNDRGGQTFAGISRKNWPHWPGWAMLDAGERPSPDNVRAFYQENFWEPLALNGVDNAAVARTIFDFGVNASNNTAAQLAQLVAGATPDGHIGPKTIAALNTVEPALFMAHYALAKIAYYAKIATKDKSQLGFLLGWINRTLKEAH